MRILSFGTDAKVFDRDSESARRMAGYGEAVERYDIVARSGASGNDLELSPKTRVYAARGRFFVPTAIMAAVRARRFSGWDIVTAENPFDVGFAAWVVARLSGAAFHLQVHGDFFGSREWRLASRANRWIKYHLAVFLARRADGIRVVSERVKRGVVTHGILAERVIVSPIAAAASCDPSDAVTVRSEFPTVLYVGRFEKEKNPFLIVRAFSAVVRAFPEARLRLVGGGSLENDLRQMVASSALIDSVDFVEWTSDLAREYRSAWVLAVPSDHEGWGRVVAEAASCRLPVVMTDVGCAGELVRDGESGWVVPVGDAEAMSAALLAALRDRTDAACRADALHDDAAALAGKGVGPLLASWDSAVAISKAVTAPALRDLKRLVLVAVAAHVAMYLLFLARFGTGGEWGWYVLGSDDLGYLRLARNLWHGVFSQAVAAPYLPDSDRMPIYPLFLSMMRFVPAWATVAVQQVFSIGGVLIWYKLAKRIAPAKVAWWSAALFAIEPTMRFWTAQFATEAVFSVFWFGALLAFSDLLADGRKRSAVAVGALLGLSVLTRPIALFYPAVLVVALAIGSRRDLAAAARLAVLTLAAMALVLAPWVARNAVVFGMPAVSLKGSGIMFGENAPTYLMWKYGITREEAFERMVSSLPRRDFVQPRDNAELDRAVAAVVKSDPVGFSYVMSLSAIPFFFGDGYASIVRTFAPTAAAPIVRWDGSVSGYLKDLASSGAGAMTAVYTFGKVFTVATFLAALLGAWSMSRGKGKGAIVAWLVLTVLYFAATSGTIAYSRYRFPIQPVLFLFACYGIMVVWKQFREKRAG